MNWSVFNKVLMGNKYSLQKEHQLIAMTQPTFWETCEFLKTSVPDFRRYNKGQDFSKYKSYVRVFFDVSPSELIDFLKCRPDVCHKLSLASSDKRHTPSTFFDEKEDGQYLVGWVNGADTMPTIVDIHVFNQLYEAAADYVLFSWDLPRLTALDALFSETDHYY